MSGDVPDPASWVAGATKSELEKLLVFLGDATDPESKLWIADYWSESKWHVCSCMGTLRVWTHVGLQLIYYIPKFRTHADLTESKLWTAECWNESKAWTSECWSVGVSPKLGLL